MHASDIDSEDEGRPEVRCTSLGAALACARCMAYAACRLSVHVAATAGSVSTDCMWHLMASGSQPVGRSAVNVGFMHVVWLPFCQAHCIAANIQDSMMNLYLT